MVAGPLSVVVLSQSAHHTHRPTSSTIDNDVALHLATSNNAATPLTCIAHPAQFVKRHPVLEKTTRGPREDYTPC